MQLRAVLPKPQVDNPINTCGCRSIGIRTIEITLEQYSMSVVEPPTHRIGILS